MAFKGKRWLKFLIDRKIDQETSESEISSSTRTKYEEMKTVITKELYRDIDNE